MYICMYASKYKVNLFPTSTNGNKLFHYKFIIEVEKI